MWSASNLQAMSLRPRIIQPHFFNDGCTEFRQHIILGWSSINRVKINHYLASPLQMQCCAILDGRSKIGSDNFPGDSAFDAKTRIFKQHLLGKHPVHYLWDDAKSQVRIQKEL